MKSPKWGQYHPVDSLNLMPPFGNTIFAHPPDFNSVNLYFSFATFGGCVLSVIKFQESLSQVLHCALIALTSRQRKLLPKANFGIQWLKQLRNIFNILIYISERQVVYCFKISKLISRAYRRDCNVIYKQIYLWNWWGTSVTKLSHNPRIATFGR